MTVYPVTCSHVLKVPFETGGTGIVYIWIGSQATQEEAIHAEQMGRSMFDVSLRLLHWQVSVARTKNHSISVFFTHPTLSSSDMYVQSTFSNVLVQEGSEPENFFWVALGGRKEYETVS